MGHANSCKSCCGGRPAVFDECKGTPLDRPMPDDVQRDSSETSQPIRKCLESGGETHEGLVVPISHVVQIEGGVIAQPLGSQDCCWPVVAVHSRWQGCGGTLFADSATKPRVVCYVGCGIQFGGFSQCVSQSCEAVTCSVEAAIPVCVAAVRKAISSGILCRAGLPVWYLERSLIAPLREGLKGEFERPVRLMESPNRMGMFIRQPSEQLAAAPTLPSDCVLRRLSDHDVAHVNEESGPGPNHMERGGIGCWGVEVSGTLQGWAVRGADGAIGMLHVSKEWRRRKLATAIVHQISEELHALGLPCFSFVRDDNIPSKATFVRVGYKRVADVKWCHVRLI